tara:strand:+ start:12698 stop:12862 length:165 start_codon:yes stop_codon:yes gene_type:complete
MKVKILLYVTSALAIVSIGYYVYEKRRVKALNEKVDSMEDALKEWEERNKQNQN